MGKRRRIKRMGRLQREILELLAQGPVTTTQMAKLLDRRYSSVRRSLEELEAKHLVTGSYYIYSSPQIMALHCWLWRLTSDEERRSGRIDRRVDLRQAELIRKLIEERAARVEEVIELEREIFRRRQRALGEGAGERGGEGNS